MVKVKGQWNQKVSKTTTRGQSSASHTQLLLVFGFCDTRGLTHTHTLRGRKVLRFRDHRARFEKSPPRIHPHWVLRLHFLRKCTVVFCTLAGVLYNQQRPMRLRGKKWNTNKSPPMAPQLSFTVAACNWALAALPATGWYLFWAFASAARRYSGQKKTNQQFLWCNRLMTCSD